MKRLGLVACFAILGMLSATLAQESGDPKHGLAVAKQICGLCHAVEKGTSPNPNAPDFATIAATPGMSAIALNVALRTSHQSMPNLVLAPDEHNDVVAYILSLRAGN
jgi:mono/diheme cytochrome c family protein